MADVLEYDIAEIEGGNLDSDQAGSLINDLLDLLDEIEMSQDWRLAGDRFDIARQNGLTVNFGRRSTESLH